MKPRAWWEDADNRAAFRVELGEVAAGELGEHEDPPGSNLTKYGKFYGMNGSPWCAMLVSWVYAETAKRLDVENPLAGLQGRRGFAHVATGFDNARRRGLVIGAKVRPMAGDVMCWNNDHVPGGPGHTGLVVRVTVTGGRLVLRVIEGNTDGSYSRTGGNVMAHDHTIGDGRHHVLLGFIRPSRSFWRPDTGLVLPAAPKKRKPTP